MEWLGDIPTWITALAVIFAIAQYRADRDDRQRARDREERAQATGLTAWTVTDATEGARHYGVVLSNTSGSMFHDLRIDATLHNEPTRQLHLQVLPPGEYVVEHTKGNTYEWGFPEPVASCTFALRPYMNSPKYRVRSVVFTDNHRQTWQSDEHAVLTTVNEGQRDTA